MKYLSVVLFALLMVWTWVIIHRDASVSFETHAGIQSKISQIILDTVRNKKPQASEVSVINVWTELTGQNSLKAHFSYKYRDGDTQSEVKGEGLLERQSEEKWKLSEVKTTSDSISFDQPMIITTGEQ
jgi:hypothetical protein